jgi:hypothetical protein
MQEAEVPLNNLPGDLLDVDVTRDGNFVAIAGDELHRVLLFSEAAVDLPEFVRFPLVRAVNEHSAVVVDTRTQKYRKANAWIIERSGSIAASFFAGDGIADVLVSDSHLVVTYFDEGVFSGVRPSEQGLVAFDLAGNLIFEYQKHFGADAVDIADCYCACSSGGSQLFFSPYTGFPLVALNLRTRKQTVHSIPSTLHGAAALSVRADFVYFYSPYANKNEFFALKIGEENAESCGRYSGRLRGLVGGNFLTHGTSGYAIVFMSD